MDFMSFGFTMAFCALFSKTFRVHRIFLNKTLRTVTNKIIIKTIDNNSNNINE